MNINRRYFWGLLALGLGISACSTKKDAFLNRNWHALNTKYNTLYNGNIAFEEGREELNASFKDDYWAVLPVERLTVHNQVKLDSEDNNPKFAIAEEKATKAVQKHGMEIKDRERNPQTDEAFLLLGKARYFDQRFIPALDAFNYILRKHTYSDKLAEARIWREKTNIRLENDELAIDNLKQLFKYDDLSDQEYADARAIMAQAYINLQVADTAIHQLKIAATYTKKKEEKGRYYFIIGQLFNELNQKDSANYAFDKVIALNRKSPRVYMINSHLKKLLNTDITPENKETLLEHLTELEENRENRPFLDKIYRGFARYHLISGNDSLALSYYNKSLRAAQGDQKLNALNYENLAVYNFDQNNYKLAGAYYDSVLTNLNNKNARKYRAIKKKLDNLEDVINYEEVVYETDSIISLYNMNEVERNGYFQKYIDEMKAAEEAAKIAEKKSQDAGFATFINSPGGKENKGKFYFYNVTSLGYGKTNFKNYWGDRALEDDWRWANKTILQLADATLEEINTEELQDLSAGQERKYDINFYLEQIPCNPKTIDSLKTERNFANYQLGLIYKEKFKENGLAAGKLEMVLKSAPEKRLVLPSKYNLFKIYEEEGSVLATNIKEDIIKNHPNSRYALILQNPNTILEGDANSAVAVYNKLYALYKEQAYIQVIIKAEESITTFAGDPSIPKLEMLKANATGRLHGFNAFKESLTYIALNYPNKPEGKKAQQILDEQLKKLASKEFVKQGTGNWKLVFPLASADKEKINKLKELLSKSLKDANYDHKLSRDVYNLQTDFIVIHDFTSKEFALGYAELLKNNKDYKIKDQNFVILSANYKIVQVHKNLDDYKNGLLTPKP